MTVFEGALTLVRENIVLLVFVHAALHARSEVMKIWRDAATRVEVRYGRVMVWTKALLSVMALLGFLVAIAPAIYYGQIAFGRFAGLAVHH